MPRETPKQRLASVLLKEPVVPWIQQRREAGKTWRAIAADLTALTGGEINVPAQTLINWIAVVDSASAAPAEASA